MEKDQLKTDCHASREFLLSAPVAPEGRVHNRPPTEADVQLLQNAFPAMESGLKTGDVFTAASLEVFNDSSSFGAMAIRIDPAAPGTISMEIGNEDVHLVFLAGLVNDIAATNGGRWGLVHQGILGLFLPGRDEPERYESGYRSVAEAIRSGFTRQNRNTVSIGISGYPQDDCSRGQIMANALKALDHAAFLGPGMIVKFDAVSLNISGDRLYHLGDLKGSMTEFQYALRLDPTNVNVRNSLGVCHGVLKQYPEALSEFEAAIRSAPGEVMAIYNYGLVHMLTHHPNRALDYLLQAERIRDDVFEVAFHIGKVYLQLDQPEKALAYFKKAEALNAETAGVYRLIGRCLVRLGDPDGAVAAYTRAVRINPNDAEALSDLGRQYDLRDENLEIAILFCERSVHLDPENGRFHHRLGRLYRKAHKLSAALGTFEKAASLGADCQAAIDEINEIIGDNSEKASGM